MEQEPIHLHPKVQQAQLRYTCQNLCLALQHSSIRVRTIMQGITFLHLLSCEEIGLLIRDDGVESEVMEWKSMK